MEIGKNSDQLTMKKKELGVPEKQGNRKFEIFRDPPPEHSTTPPPIPLGW